MYICIYVYVDIRQTHPNTRVSGLSTPLGFLDSQQNQAARWQCGAPFVRARFHQARFPMSTKYRLYTVPRGAEKELFSALAANNPATCKSQYVNCFQSSFRDLACAPEHAMHHLNKFRKGNGTRNVCISWIGVVRVRAFALVGEQGCVLIQTSEQMASWKIEERLIRAKLSYSLACLKCLVLQTK